MERATHCKLCENRLVDVFKGTLCALTQEKPAFDGKCPVIDFGAAHEKEIKEVNVKHHLLKQTQTITYMNFAVFMVISLGTVVVGYLVGVYAMERGVLSTIPLAIIGVGLALLPVAIGPLYKYLQKMKLAEEKKEALDTVLALYNIEYAIEMDVKKAIHGKQEVESRLTFLRKHFR